MKAGGTVGALIGVLAPWMGADGAAGISASDETTEPSESLELAQDATSRLTLAPLQIFDRFGLAHHRLCCSGWTF